MDTHWIDPESGRRQQSLGEEIANSVSHGVAFIAVLAATPFMLRHAAQTPGASVLGVGLFLASLAFLYLTSTIYHALPRGRSKHVFRIIEHMAIYLLIAGSYAPFTLGVLRGPWGWSLFGTVWTLAIAGVLLKAFGGVRYAKTALTLYLLMGWVVIVAIDPLWEHMAHRGFLWILMGGLAYTGGVVFYANDHRLRYSHFVWHLFVMAGTACHLIAVYGYSA